MHCVRGTYRRPTQFVYMRNVDSVVFVNNIFCFRLLVSILSLVYMRAREMLERKDQRIHGPWLMRVGACLLLCAACCVCGNSVFVVVVAVVVAVVGAIAAARIFAMYSVVLCECGKMKEKKIFPTAAAATSYGVTADVCFIFFGHNRSALSIHII